MSSLPEGGGVGSQKKADDDNSTEMLLELDNKGGGAHAVTWIKTFGSQRQENEQLRKALSPVERLQGEHCHFLQSTEGGH